MIRGLSPHNQTNKYIDKESRNQYNIDLQKYEYLQNLKKNETQDISKAEYDDLYSKNNEINNINKSLEEQNHTKLFENDKYNIFKSPRYNPKFNNYPLESVPERSIEQSQTTTNANRSGEIDSLRLRNDLDIHKNFGLSNISSYRFDNKYDTKQRLNNDHDYKSKEVDKANMSYFMPPRYQGNAIDPDLRLTHKSPERFRHVEGSEFISSSSSKKKINQSSNISGQDNYDAKRHEVQNATNSTHDINNNLYNKLNITNSPVYANDYSINRNNSNNHQYDKTQLEKSDDKKYFIKGDSGIKEKEPSLGIIDNANTFQSIPKKSTENDEKIFNLEQINSQMRMHQAELFDEVKTCQKALKEKDIKIQNLKNYIDELIKQNEDLNKVNIERLNFIKTLEKQIEKLRYENSIRNEDINLTESKVLKLERTNHDLSQEKIFLNTKIDKLIKDNQLLTQDNEKLMKRIENILKLREKDQLYYRNDESYFDKVDHQSKSESKIKYNILGNKYLDTSTKAKEEYDFLKPDLQKKPSMKMFKENEYTKNLPLEDTRNLSREMRKSATEIGYTKQILKAIQDELQIESINDIIPKIRDLIHYEKSTMKFTSCIQNLVLRCSPPDTFTDTPTLKQAWKWLKNLMEEYMNLKKNISSSNSRNILQGIMEYLNLDDKNEIISTIKQIDMEREMMIKIINKVKILHNIQWIKELNDIEEKLDIELHNQSQLGSDKKARNHSTRKFNS